MAMTWIWTLIMAFSLIWGILSGNITALGTAAMEGAGAAVRLCIEIGGAVCLWCGVMEIMERAGLTAALSRALSPVLSRLFPSCRKDRRVLDALSGNVAANFLGLGNAATPLGIRAVSLMAGGGRSATDEMCLLIVINTASIQLIPATVAAVRAAAGCGTPFDILPAVWASSAVSVFAGVAAAKLFKRIWRK